MPQPPCDPSLEDAQGWRQLGLAHRDRQRMVEATTALARAAALAPHDLTIAWEHAEVRFASGLPAADLLYRLHRQVGHLAALQLTAAALHAEGRGAAAEALLEAALNVRPDWLDGHRSLSELRWKSGQGTESARSYAAAIRAQPQNSALHLAWFYTMAMVRDWAAARRILDAGERILGGAPFTLARLYVASESGDASQAEALIERCAAVDDAGLDVCRIRHFLRTRQLAKAEVVALRLSRSASGRLAWPYLSLIWRLQGQPRGEDRAQWLDGSPPYVRSFDLGLTTGELAELAALLRSLHTDQAPHLEQSVRGGTQTDRPLFFRHEPIIQLTKQRILGAIAAYVDALPARDAAHPLLGTVRGDILFEGSWSVRLAGGGFHVSHIHPRGWISSAFYVSLPNGGLGEAPAGWLVFGAPPPELGLELEPYLRVEPRPGRLVLFPSTMWHATLPFATGERLVIAFDVRGT